MNIKLDNIPNKSQHNSTFGLLVGTKPRRKRSWSKHNTMEESKLNILANRIVGFFRLPFQRRFCVEIKKIIFNLKKELFSLKSLLQIKFSEQFDVDILENSALYIGVLRFVDVQA